MKLCKDCEYFTINTTHWETPHFQNKYAVCGLTQRTGFDGTKCYTRRHSWFDSCGPKGRQFELKEAA